MAGATHHLACWLDEALQMHCWEVWNEIRQSSESKEFFSWEENFLNLTFISFQFQNQLQKHVNGHFNGSDQLAERKRSSDPLILKKVKKDVKKAAAFKARRQPWAGKQRILYFFCRTYKRSQLWDCKSNQLQFWFLKHVDSTFSTLVWWRCSSIDCRKSRRCTKATIWWWRSVAKLPASVDRVPALTSLKLHGSRRTCE